MSLDNVRLIETRLLVKRQNGWVALPYIWNPDETEARLAIAGDLQSIRLENRQAFNYLVPDQNQCAGCHRTNYSSSENKRALLPIGPTLSNLNRDDQLALWHSKGLLADYQEVAPMADWRDSIMQERQLAFSTQSEYQAAISNNTEKMARSYLHINCAHCHNPQGPADTSGLFLQLAETNPTRLGRCKPTIAAGQGTGGHTYSIVPGKPAESILVYRMKSQNPAAMMPELGRSLVHEEGITLIANWISSMTGSCTLTPI